ncbi:MAG: hypothetical protein ABIW80_03605 [Lapillicoccus sp.]
MLPRPRALMLVVALLAATSLGLSGALPAGAATADPRPGPAATPSAMPAAGTFYPTAPVRVLGSPTGGYAVSPGSPATVATAGRSGLPSSGVSALMVNVVATAGASDARLGLTAAGGVSPAPLLAVPAGTTSSTLVTVPLATTSGFDVSAVGGPATVTADVLGFYAADDTVVAGYGLSGGYQPVEVTPLYESAADTAIPPGGRVLLAVDLGGPATAHTTALLVHVTSKDTTAPGSLSVSSPSAPSPPSAVSAPGDPDAVLPATVSFAAGARAGNLALVPAEVDSSGRLGIAVTNTSAAPAGYALDLVGFYDDGGIGPNLRFRALPQTRVLDTATGLGGVSALTPGVGGRTTLADAVADDSTFALAGVLSITTAAASTVTVRSPDAVIPAAGDAPVAAGRTSVALQSEVGAGRDLTVMAGPGSGSAPMGLTLDLVGTFEAHPPVTNAAARRWVPPVSPWQISAVPRAS